LNIIYEENTAGTATHIYGPKGRLAKRTTINQETNTYYYHTDHLGSTRLITDESGNVTADVTYKPFGESALTGSEDHYLFNGKQMDSTGLYYYGARYYDPVLGRFLTRDTEKRTYKISQGLNRYSYCRNNPLSYVDPDGRMEKKITIDGARSSHPYRVFGITPPHNVFGVLLLSIPLTSKEGLVRVEGSFIKYYAPQNVTSAESSSIWAPSSVLVSMIALEIECNEEMLETLISLTTEGEFELVGYEETESGQILKVSVKIYPRSDGHVVFEFSFEVWAPGEEVEIRITLFPTTASLIPLSEDSDTEFREEWEITVPAGDGPAAI
jgi:RHS repeat-associated protein